MITAFQSSAFQNNAFQIDTGGGTVIQPGVGSSISGGHFSRKRWRELRGEMIAAHDAADRAARAKSERERAALIAASTEAKRAIEAAEASDAADRELAAMRRALEAAAGATRVTATIKHAKAALDYALAVRQRIEDEEEEEEAIALLLGH